MKMHFPQALKPKNVSDENWLSWHWQMQKSLKTQDDFSAMFELAKEESQAFEQGHEIFNIRSTPYYASLAGNHAHDPLRKILMPKTQELSMGQQSEKDPLGENKNCPTPRIIHRYSDRVLFLVTDICSVYCRYCTRKHFTGQDQALIPPNEYQKALEYIQTHPGIREVILSGGDPLTLSDGQLEKILNDIRAISHVEIIRIGTRMPVVCPMRVTEKLVKILKPANPVYLMTHFNHPRELTSEAAQALGLFVDNGIPVLNQMVLLNGVNNHPSEALLHVSVRPFRGN
jgi:lysine 2,3-aminomutase